MLSLPAFPKVCDEVSNHGHFPEPLIRKLHAGIWANERRHFAVLTGLSGSGKTLLARAYGKAIAGDPRWESGASTLSTRIKLVPCSMV